MSISRREFLKWSAAAGVLASGIGGCAAPGARGAHVVVVGGGFGGATAAKYLRLMDPGVRVTLVEPAKTYYTCPFSNTVLGGLNPMSFIAHDYSGLEKRGVEVVHERALAIDPDARVVRLAGGESLQYDRAIVSPGISMQWGAIEGYDERAAERMPHAWQAGEQTRLLRRQIEYMPDGGTMVIAVPDNPFRCPPGPYERASLIAWYLRQHKPRSKILILDSKDKFSKQGLFTQAWNEQLYSDVIEWVPLSKGGAVTRVDAARGTVHTDFDNFTPHVANIIPPQRAGQIALDADLADNTGWCPVDPQTFESTRHPGIHVIGDSCIAGALPKSGYAANSEGKVCAAAVVAALQEQPPPAPSWINTCYSLVAPDLGISVAAVYRLRGGEIIEADGGGVSADLSTAQYEANFARGWYANITADMFG